MDAARWERIKSVFQEAFDRDPAERAAWLDAACGEDLGLRDAVQRLIDSHAGAGAFLETPLFASTEPPPVDHLLGRTVGPYRIDARIAVGGMGEVYRAHDARLDRAVALKLLPAVVAADPDRLRRFHAEARAASSLNHPHILVIHDFGDADGRPFMVTEFVEGETLRERLRAGPLAVRDALDLMAQVASALSAAHARGLVHRDVKPENVMIRSDGYVKLLDFGLAKIAEGGARAEAARHTMTGMALGTPRYMSPEQALGQPVDARSDVFSCGAMLYEMVAGRAAFEGATPAGIFDAVLHQSPPPPTAVNPSVPAALARVIDKALAKAPAARYQRVSELLEDLNQLRSDTAGAGSPRDGARRLLQTTAAVGILLAVFAVWAVWNGRREAASPSPGVADVATRLVVLPFENLTGQSADDWLAGGFSDSLTFGLQNVGDLVLVNRERISELYRSEGVREPGALDPAVVTRLSKQLAVRYYVHGSYQRVGDTIKVVSRLVDAATGEIKAQESVTDRFANVLQVEDELARRFAASFAASVAPRPAPPTRSLEAYQAVTEARTFYADGQYPRAIPLLERAVVLDPQYGEAWALLSKAHSRTTTQASFAVSSLDAAHAAAMQAAERAVALAPGFYDAHVALALVSRHTGRLSDWRREARRAIELAPRVAEPYGLLADSYSAIPGSCSSRDQDATIAADYYRRAIALDTRDATAYGNLAYHFLWHEDIDQAIRTSDQGFARLPDNRTMRRRQVLKFVLLGRPDEAEAAFPRFIPGELAPGDRLLLGTIRAAQNRPAEAAALFDDVIRAAPLPINALWAARIFAQHGNDDRAVTYLQRAVSMEPACAAFVAQSPIFKSLQAHPAVRALVTRR